MPHPQVSVCIPTYNGTSFLEEALASVESQTYKNIEVVISDDHSTDSTWNMLESFRESTTIPVRLYKHKPNGIGANWNHCLKKAQGEYIKFLFQDDVLEPSCIEKMIHFIEQNPTYPLVACKRSFICEMPHSTETKDWLSKYGDLQAQISRDQPIVHLDKTLFSSPLFNRTPKNKIGEPPTVLFRKSILEEVGYFDENLKQVLDYVFYYRILKKHPIAILPEKLVKFRIHPNQATNVNRGIKIEDYKKYDKILYKEFRSLLHPKVRFRLQKKYNFFYRNALKLKRKFYPVGK